MKDIDGIVILNEMKDLIVIQRNTLIIYMNR
jgi:hypothetical protein